MTSLIQLMFSINALGAQLPPQKRRVRYVKSKQVNVMREKFYENKNL